MRRVLVGAMAVVSLVCGASISPFVNAWPRSDVEYSPLQRFCQVFPNFPGCRDNP